MATKTIGTIHPKRTMFLRHAVGNIKDSESNEYEATANVSDMSPIICSKQTGKYFTLNWDDIVRLAIDAGVDEDE